MKGYTLAMKRYLKFVRLSSSSWKPTTEFTWGILQHHSLKESSILIILLI